MTKGVILSNSDSSHHCECNEKELMNNGDDIIINEQLPALFSGYGYHSPRRDVSAIFVFDSLAYSALLVMLITYRLDIVDGVIWQFVLLLLLTAIYGCFLFQKGAKRFRFLGYMLTYFVAVAVAMFPESIIFRVLVMTMWSLQLAALVLDWHIYSSSSTELKRMEADLSEEQVEKKIWLVRERRELWLHRMALIYSQYLSIISLITTVLK